MSFIAFFSVLDFWVNLENRQRIVRFYGVSLKGAKSQEIFRMLKDVDMAEFPRGTVFPVSMPQA